MTENNHRETRLSFLTPADQFSECSTPPRRGVLGLVKQGLRLFENYRSLQIILRHHVFNEGEAAGYCRCSVESIRYHALRSRKLACLKFSKEGLVFLKRDLDAFLDACRVEGFRDHS